MKLEISGDIDLATKKEIQVSAPEIFNKLGQKTSNLHLEVVFSSPEEIRQINHKYRKIDKATDVLSFPQTQFPVTVNSIGTIFICPEVAETEKIEIIELLKHGILHLLGFDHESNHEEWIQKAAIINHNMGL
ncbi:MAG: Endoribonuclease YbeY [bacterium ADurb.Bin212]|mgnify:CR=1 FL=1|nr:MAG: Endoribonuclease YbeY [bacterium ADurb.Bin212]